MQSGFMQFRYFCIVFFSTALFEIMRSGIEKIAVSRK